MYSKLRWCIHVRPGKSSEKIWQQRRFSVVCYAKWYTLSSVGIVKPFCHISPSRVAVRSTGLLRWILRRNPTRSAEAARTDRSRPDQLDKAAKRLRLAQHNVESANRELHLAKMAYGVSWLWLYIYSFCLMICLQFSAYNASRCRLCVLWLSMMSVHLQAWFTNKTIGYVLHSQRLQICLSPVQVLCDTCFEIGN